MKILFRLSFILLIALSLSNCTRRPATPVSDNETILDAYWLLVSLEGAELQASNTVQTAYIRFQESENDVFGYTGCNKLKGKYNLNGNTLQLQDLSTTRMSCPSLATENRLLEALRGVTGYRKAGEILTLYAGDKAVATFRTGSISDIEGGMR